MEEMTATPATGTRASVRRIAMVAPSLDILGGQGVQAVGLAKALRGEGYDVEFVPVNPAFPPGLKWLRKIPVCRTVFNQLLYVPGLYRLRRADVIHVYSASYWSFLLAPVPAILIARLLGKRVVLNYHSGEAMDHLTNWGLAVHPWLRLVDEIVVPSVYLESVFRQFGYASTVIRNMVDTSSFSFRQRLPLQPRLLSVRNLEPHYGVLNTLRAFAIVKRQCPGASLTVAGYGSEEAKLIQWVRDHRLEGVQFIGRTEPEEMPGLYDAADIFLNSSTIDNQPVSILEAFAAGVNVVSTPTGDIPAMVQDGVTGQLVPRDDPESLAAAVLWLLKEPQQAAMMAKRAHEEIGKYTWPFIKKEWAEVYRKDRT